LIIGLGNPGLLYNGTRHNIGSYALKCLAKARRIALKKESGIKAFSAKTKIAHQDVVLSIPATFMNLSGEAVKALLKKYNVRLEDLLIVCDDLDLEFGRLKLRPAGSSAGHRGIKSVMDILGQADFNRLRIGIGRPKASKDPAEFVLERFNSQEKKEIPEIVSRTLECIDCWVSEGTQKCMNIFNRSS
jgi:PTH1 family peptidyl-tRNA hydrolase